VRLWDLRRLVVQLKYLIDPPREAKGPALGA